MGSERFPIRNWPLFPPSVIIPECALRHNGFKPTATALITNDANNTKTTDMAIARKQDSLRAVRVIRVVRDECSLVCDECS